MSPDKFQKVERIFHEALYYLPSERAIYIEKACCGDDEIRREVESLLSFADEADSFIELPDDLAASLLKPDNNQKLIGKLMNQYRILSLLGVGGMGEVYLAEDTKLGRKAALKLLPAHFTTDPERTQRFEQEARAASALNHPSIITIYGIEKAEKRHFIATEFIDGQTLRERINQSDLSFKEKLEIGIQIAGALESAHSEGIIHRDIKPANIMLRRDGYVKVLDFGLAKLTDTSRAGLDTKEFTKQGRVMGTINYMSPEQALGNSIDHRTDIFSLGVVLYEMFSGEQPFQGNSDAAVYDAILHKTPPPLPDDQSVLMPKLEQIINHAMEKDPALRYQNVAEMKAELQALKDASISGKSFDNLRQPVRQTTSFSLKNILILVSVVIAIITISYFSLFPGNSKNTSTLKKINITQLTNQNGVELFPSLSSDGKSIIYTNRSSGNWDIYLQRVGGTNTINLTNDSVADDMQAVYSPDNEQIAFRSERDGGGIFVMGATGESVTRITDFGFYPTWSPDKKEIAFCVDNFEEPMSRKTVPSGLWAVNVQTGNKRLINKQDSIQPNWSPNGYRIAFWGVNAGGQRDIWTISADGNEIPTQITNDSYIDWNPVWSPDGKYLYFTSDRSGSMNLWRVMIDEKTGNVLDNPEPITIPSTYSQHFSFSRDGKHFVYVKVNSYTNILQIGFNSQRESVEEKITEITQGSKITTNPDSSPDGEWLAFDGIGATQEDIYVIRRDGTGLRQLTNDIYKDRAPRWSPDGKRIAFFSDRTGRYEGWIIDADGSNLQQVTHTKEKWAQLPVWSPDGQQLLFNTSNSYPIIFDVNKSWLEQTPKELPARNDPELWLMAYAWSQDGKKLAAYERRAELYSSGIILYDFITGKYETLTKFGVRPIWLSDSRRLIFIEEDKVYLLDTQSKKMKEIMSVKPDRLQSLNISNDNNSIFYSLQRTEADIWFAVME